VQDIVKKEICIKPCGVRIIVRIRGTIVKMSSDHCVGDGILAYS
jgi:hypothetical protein